MADHVEAQARLLEPTLGSATSPASRRVVQSLRALPPAELEYFLARYAGWDLGNLVRCALAAGASANTRHGPNDTPVLTFAAQEDSARSLKALLTGGADVRLLDRTGNTALHLAAQEGATSCVVQLLAAGAPLEVKGVEGHTPLSMSALTGHTDAVALLLQRGANANAFNTRSGNTHLMASVAGKLERCVELLLPRSDVSIVNKRGLNAFHVSVMTASYDCFKLLLPRMADVDVRTVPGVNAAGQAVPSGQTAAHIACVKGQHKMLEKLLRRGASRTARDSMQGTPLHYAAVAGQLSCIVQLIGHPEAYKMAQADINSTNADGWTPLHCAARFGHAKCCGLLIAAGARLDTRRTAAGWRGWLRWGSRDGTPLMVAQQEHPSNTALHDLLAGRGPAHPPGTTCDRCGCPEDPASHLMPCSGCQVARYCSIACQHAAWAAHEPECSRLKAEREHFTRTTTHPGELPP